MPPSSRESENLKRGDSWSGEQVLRHVADDGATSAQSTFSSGCFSEVGLILEGRGLLSMILCKRMAWGR